MVVEIMKIDRRESAPIRHVDRADSNAARRHGRLSAQDVRQKGGRRGHQFQMPVLIQQIPFIVMPITTLAHHLPQELVQTKQRIETKLATMP